MSKNSFGINKERLSESILSDNILAYGDQVCFYHELSNGFLFSDRTAFWSSANLFVSNDEENKYHPNVSDVSSITFEICVQNRYKLGKKAKDNKNDEMAKAEEKDNLKDQNRLCGKAIRYGEIVQFRHIFTNKYVHVSSKSTSSISKNKCVIVLEDYNAKQAWFRVLPRGKIKYLGDFIEYSDQIIIESIKMPGCYLNISKRYDIDSLTKAREVNVGVELDHSFFSIMRHYRRKDEIAESSSSSSASASASAYKNYLRGSCITRIFHLEYEAYLCSKIEKIPDTYFRIRNIDKFNIRSLRPSTSANVFWQIEKADSLIDGETIIWKEQIRLRHLPTRLYLYCKEEEGGNNEGKNNYVYRLTDNYKDFRTLFAFYPVASNLFGSNVEENLISRESRVRIFHLVSNSWLHASSAFAYECKDDTQLLKVISVSKAEYPDVFSLQSLDYREEVVAFNYVAGLLPFLRDLVQQRHNNQIWYGRDTERIIKKLTELENFLSNKQRRKYLRNLSLMSDIIELLKCPLYNISDEHNLVIVFRHVYQVLVRFTEGNSRKNAVYCANHVDILRIHLDGSMGLNRECCKVLINVCRDNLSIIQTLTSESGTFLTTFFIFLRRNPHHTFLILLGILCVCNEKAFVNNQNKICDALLVNQNEENVGAAAGELLYNLENGQDIGMPVSNSLYISTDSRQTWIPLNKFVERTKSEEYKFLVEQLELFKKLCFGRNKTALRLITKNRKYFSWETAVSGLMSEDLPYWFRSIICDLISDIFVDFGPSFDVIRLTSLNFLYEDISTDLKSIDTSSRVSRDINAEFPTLRTWLFDFLTEHSVLIAGSIGRSRLIKSVIRLVKHLLQYGYMGSQVEIEELMKSVMSLLSGFNDMPFFHDAGNKYSNRVKGEINEFRMYKRYESSKETDEILIAKKECLELIGLLMINQFNRKLKLMLTVFKEIDDNETNSSKNKKNCLQFFIKNQLTTREIFEKGKCVKLLNSIIENISKTADNLFSTLPVYLMDLTHYKSEEILVKALEILNLHSSSHTNLFDTLADCQILCSTTSIRVHRQALANMPKLKQFSNLIDMDTNDEIVNILRTFINLCHTHYDDSVPHTIAQDILINNGILRCLKKIVCNEFASGRDSQILEKSLDLFAFICKGNKVAQKYAFDNLDVFLKCTNFCPKQLANLLRDIFQNNLTLCLNIKTSSIKIISRMIYANNRLDSTFLSILSILVKDDLSSMAIKRNQMNIIKELMINYQTIAFPLSLATRERVRIIGGMEGKERQIYFYELVRLLANCAEGEKNLYIENLCQTFFSVHQLFTILNHRKVEIKLKAPFARYFVNVYMTKRKEGKHCRLMLADNDDVWNHFGALNTLLNRLKKNSPLEILEKEYRLNTADGLAANDIFRYFLDGGLELYQRYFVQFYHTKNEMNEAMKYQRREEQLKKIVQLFDYFFPIFLQEMSKPFHSQLIYSTYYILFIKCNYTKDYINRYFVSNNFFLESKRLEIVYQQFGYVDYDRQEINLNKCLKFFAKNCRLMIEGEDNIGSVLKLTDKRYRNKPYNHPDPVMRLPTGFEFRNLVEAFDDDFLSTKLIDYLIISSNGSRLGKTSNEKLDEKCLDILRALLYNKIILVGKNSNNKLKIRHRQLIYAKHKIVSCLMNLLHKDNQTILKKVMALFDNLLYNASPIIQKEIIDFSVSVKDEMFFVVIENFLKSTANELKEQRSLNIQIRQEADFRKLVDENGATVNNGSSSGSNYVYNENDDNNDIEIENAVNTNLTDKKLIINSWSKIASKTKKENLLILARNVLANRMLMFKASNSNSKTNEDLDNQILLKPILGLKSDNIKKSLLEKQLNDYPIDGTTQLILRVVKRMTIGQYLPAQSYLRYQHDNLRKVNIVQQIVGFLAGIYTYCDNDTIILLTQLIACLTELVLGNQQNRVVILNNKIIDFITSLLRRKTYFQCKNADIVELWTAIGKLLRSMIEESSPEAYSLAKDVANTLDIKVVKNILEECYKNYIELNTTTPDIENTLVLQLTQTERKDVKLISSIDDCAFIYYILLARLIDIKPTLYGSLLQEDEKSSSTSSSSSSSASWLYYKSKCQSIELVKDDYLQKIHFPVKNADVIREEIKEEIKWAVDRSTPTAKLRDFLLWSKDIFNVVPYQYKLLSNIFLRFISRTASWWEIFLMFLSFILNLLMLITWKTQPPTVVAADLSREVSTSAPNFLPSITSNNNFNNTTTIIPSLWSSNFTTIISYGGGNNLISNYSNSTIGSRRGNSGGGGGGGGGSDNNGNNDDKKIHGIYLSHPTPDIGIIDEDIFNKIFLALSITHNVISVLYFIAFCIVVHPRFDFSKLNFLSTSYGNSSSSSSSSSTDKRAQEQTKIVMDMDDVNNRNALNRPINKSQLIVKVFSLEFFINILVTVFSLLGTFFSGYFFVVHLLLIVRSNQLLRGIIMAVTQNGKSLMWVGILGLVVIYLYSLLGFAFFNMVFDPDEEMYCNTLYECSVSVFRYGLIGNYDDKFNANSQRKTFDIWVYLSFYQITFNIIVTVILLNLVFGIIVDTFSQIRNKKWDAERDMNEACFICGRDSFEFDRTKTGFDYHVKRQHNMWAYVHYFILLKSTAQIQFTAIDRYVYNQLKSDDLQFFPLNRALCLTSDDDESVDSKLESIFKKVRDIRHRQNKAFVSARLKMEDERIAKFQQEYSKWRMRGEFTDEEDEEEDGNDGGNSVMSGAISAD